MLRARRVLRGRFRLLLSEKLQPSLAGVAHQRCATPLNDWYARQVHTNHSEGEEGMIVITGSVMTNAANRAEMERLCVEHSQRSREEPGCIAHNVHADCENPDRLVFLEVWEDGNAVRTHFSVPESTAFVKTIGALSTEPPTIQIYRADEVSAAALG